MNFQKKEFYSIIRGQDMIGVIIEPCENKGKEHLFLVEIDEISVNRDETIKLNDPFVALFRQEDFSEL